MKRRLSFFSALVLCLLTVLPLLPGASAAPAVGPYDLFVSPEGDDAAPGTLQAPLKTVAAAKERLKALKDVAEPAAPVHVWLGGGRYEFSEPLRFDETDLPDVTYAAWEDETVTFSGAKALTGFTEETVNGIPVFAKKLDPETEPRSLFGASGALPATRYPETGYFTVKAPAPEDDLWTEDDTPWSFTLGQRSFYADPADLGVAFRNPEDVQVRILHYWHDELMYVTSLDRETGKIGLSRPSSMRIRDIDRYYFENVFEALNAPGEWYLDRETHTLYYVPRTGERADTLTLYAPVTERLLEIDGASGVCFEGIRFTETDWSVPVPGEWESGWRAEYDIDALQAALDVRGVVEVTRAENVWFDRCEWVSLGASALKFLKGVHRSGVENSVFREIAATAVFIGGDNLPAEDPACTADITVLNNLISGYGRRFFCAIGVHVTYCLRAEIAHNEISDGYYTAISCGWIWGYDYHLTREISIKDNLIYNIGQGWLSDMGGVYMLGAQPGTVLSGNVIHNVAADPGEGGYGGWGIYLDEGSSRMTVEKNLVYCCGSESFNIHYGEGNVIRNNIGALSGEGQVSVGSRGEEPHATAYYYDNIFLTDGGAPIYIYMLHTAHFYDNGNLFWDLSKGDSLSFATDGGGTLLSLSEAKRQGFLHNETVADPLFRDPRRYDFALAEDSPAFATHFQPWDYAAAGTLPGSVLGLGTPGGQTAYNDHAAPAEPCETRRGIDVASVLKTASAVLAALAGAACLAKLLLTEKDRTGLLLGLVCLSAVTGWFIRRTFIDWSPALYVLGVAAFSAELAAFGLLGAKTLKKPLLSFAVRSVSALAAFFALTLLLNNVLRIGEANAISVVLALAALYAAALTGRVLTRKE